jgi:crotonobetainyl-CoA:carnitine CoA-transferase CaiB-like acyl-CoA transferase
MEAGHITAGRIARHADHGDDEQALVNGMLVPFADAPDYKTIDSPFYVEGVVKRAPALAPEVGQHNAAILAELGIQLPR